MRLRKNRRFSLFKLASLVQDKAQLKLANSQGPDGLVRRTERPIIDYSIFSKYRRGLKARKNQGHFELKSQKLNQLKIGKNGKKWKKW